MKGLRDLEGTVLVQSSASPPVLRFHDSRISLSLPFTILVGNILAGLGAAMSPQMICERSELRVVLSYSQFWVEQLQDYLYNISYIYR